MKSIEIDDLVKKYYGDNADYSGTITYDEDDWGFIDFGAKTELYDSEYSHRYQVMINGNNFDIYDRHAGRYVIMANRMNNLDTELVKLKMMDVLDK